MPGSQECYVVEVAVPANQLSALILAVHQATEGSSIQGNIEHRAQHTAVTDYDQQIARVRHGLDHRPVAAVTVVHDTFIVDVTFDVRPQMATAIFCDARCESMLRNWNECEGAQLLATHTAEILESAGVAAQVVQRPLPPAHDWLFG